MRKIFIFLIGFILILTAIFNNIDLYSLKASSGLISNNTDATQYIGYGYNVAGGKAICDPDALNLNSPTVPEAVYH